MYFTEFPKATTIVVPHGLSIPKRLKKRVSWRRGGGGGGGERGESRGQVHVVSSLDIF